MLRQSNFTHWICTCRDFFANWASQIKMHALLSCKYTDIKWDVPVKYVYDPLLKCWLCFNNIVPFAALCPLLQFYLLSSKSQTCRCWNVLMKRVCFQQGTSQAEITGYAFALSTLRHNNPEYIALIHAVAQNQMNEMPKKGACFSVFWQGRAHNASTARFNDLWGVVKFGMI